MLAVRDFGGRGPGVLLLHGLAGHAGEWEPVAREMGDHARVVAFDARGHGASERRPADVSRAAHVADARQVVKERGLAPAVVAGQSLGGLTALLLAADHPELVRALVMVEAGPQAGGPGSHLQVERSLRGWPVPFATREDALAYFAGRDFPAEAWADGLEERDGALWPRFDVDVLVETLRQADSRAYWDEWERIACPILVVRGTRGTLTAEDVAEMAGRARDARLLELDTGHDVHLERPGELAGALRELAR